MWWGPGGILGLFFLVGVVAHVGLRWRAAFWRVIFVLVTVVFLIIPVIPVVVMWGRRSEWWDRDSHTAFQFGRTEENLFSVQFCIFGYGRGVIDESGAQQGWGVAQVLAQTGRRDDESLAPVLDYVVDVHIIRTTCAQHLVGRWTMQQSPAHHGKVSLVQVNVLGGGDGEVADDGLSVRKALLVVFTVQDIDQGLAGDMAG